MMGQVSNSFVTAKLKLLNHVNRALFKNQTLEPGVGCTTTLESPKVTDSNNQTVLYNLYFQFPIYLGSGVFPRISCRHQPAEVGFL